MIISVNTMTILHFNSMLQSETRAFWISVLLRCVTQGYDQVCWKKYTYLMTLSLLEVEHYTVGKVFSVTTIGRRDSKSKFQMSTPFSSSHNGCIITWRLCKFSTFLRNISMNIWSLGKRTGFKVGEVSFLAIF